MKELYRCCWIVGCALGVAACSSTSDPSSSGSGGSTGATTSSGAAGMGGAPSASPAEVVDTIETDSDYAAYTSLAVNNGHFALRDGHDQLHVAWLNQAGVPTVGTQGIDGEWIHQELAVHATGTELKNPNLMQRGDDFVAGWMERDGDQTHLVVADGVLQSPGAALAHVWNTRHITSIPYTDPSTEPKYLSMSVTANGPLFGFTEGMPDVQARVIAEGGELAMSLIKSGLYTFIKSSDVTLDSAGDFGVVVWEENWSDPQFGPGKDANLLFVTTSDGGSTWSAPAHVLGPGPTPGGDPSVYCTEDGTMYLAFHLVEPVEKGGSSPPGDFRAKRTSVSSMRRGSMRLADSAQVGSRRSTVFRTASPCLGSRPMASTRRNTSTAWRSPT